MKRFFNWLADRVGSRKTTRGPLPKPAGSVPRPRGHAGVVRSAPPPQAVPRRQPEYVDVDPNVAGRIENAGPGKNVLIRNRYQREDTGTHETLTILDDSMLESGEQSGIDPYNTGQFDRSRNWDKRYRK